VANSFLVHLPVSEFVVNPVKSLFSSFSASNRASFTSPKVRGASVPDIVFESFGSIDNRVSLFE
jgi:hypothetical protein